MDAKQGELSPLPDLDDDGIIGLTDAVLLLSFLFQGGAPPAVPFAACGVDPTAAHGLHCARHEPCE